MPLFSRPKNQLLPIHNAHRSKMDSPKHFLFPFPRTWLGATGDVINHHLHLGRHLGRSKCIKETDCATGVIDSRELECSVSVIVDAKHRSAFGCYIDLPALACKAIGLGLHNQYNSGYGRVLRMTWQSLSSSNKIRL